MVREEEIVRNETEGVQPQEAKFSSEDTDTTPCEVVTDKHSRLSLSLAWAFAPVMLSVLVATVVIKIAFPTILQPRIWTAEELSKYDGTSKGQPILLSILGSVFDVSQGTSHYGPGGGYHHFTGRDASRAFVSGNFSGNGLTSSLKGLSPQQVKSIDGWEKFFRKKYKYVGILVGAFYDEFGQPTKELARVRRLIVRAEKEIEAQKRDEEQFPACNSRWSPKEGAEVWCKTGYPRIVDKVLEGTYKGAPPQTRCACFEETFLGKKGLRLYEGCAPLSRKCQSAPPKVNNS